MKEDIKDRKDIERLITAFYDQVKNDDTIGFIFIDMAKVNWEKHLPVMFDFWENILFNTGVYRGDPMQVHKDLNKRIPLTPAHFLQWNKLFSSTIDELFEGENAERAKQRASSISFMIEMKISESN